MHVFKNPDDSFFLNERSLNNWMQIPNLKVYALPKAFVENRHIYILQKKYFSPIYSHPFTRPDTFIRIKLMKLGEIRNNICNLFLYFEKQG